RARRPTPPAAATIRKAAINPAAIPPANAARRRRLHLSGRRQLERRDLSGAAGCQTPPLRRAALSAAAKSILRQSRLRAAAAALLPAARVVQLIRPDRICRVR